MQRKEGRKKEARKAGRKEKRTNKPCLRLWNNVLPLVWSYSSAVRLILQYGPSDASKTSAIISYCVRFTSPFFPITTGQKRKETRKSKKLRIVAMLLICHEYCEHALASFRWLGNIFANMKGLLGKGTIDKASKYK